jgi:hypothetical protein
MTRHTYRYSMHYSAEKVGSFENLVAFGERERDKTPLDVSNRRSRTAEASLTTSWPRRSSGTENANALSSRPSSKSRRRKKDRSRGPAEAASGGTPSVGRLGSVAEIWATDGEGQTSSNGPSVRPGKPVLLASRTLDICPIIVRYSDPASM